MFKPKPKYEAGDVVSFHFSRTHREEHNGMIVTSWRNWNNKIIYEIASMNHGMCSYSVSESCIIKKL